MNAHEQLAAYVATHSHLVSQLVELDLANDSLLQLDFTENNKALQPQDIADTARFSHWVNTKLKESGCRYGIGGYMEHRTVYSRSALFDTGEEPRRLHLGTDIWAEAGTPVYAPLQGTVHSFHDNNRFGDY
jgi:murein DD-endopeptidase MepM/ murein hydrolase activator NlpD